MKVIVGLGNPGDKFVNTRHNVGFAVVEALAEKKFSGALFHFQRKFDAEVYQSKDLLLVKPQTYMNDSGRTVKRILDYYQVNVENMWLVHDDLDIKWGDFKIQHGKGPKIHNGVNSVEDDLNNMNFWRVRVGVDNRDGEEYKIPGKEFVLKRLSIEEQSELQEIVQKIVGDLVARLHI